MDPGLALAGAVGICLLGGFLPWLNTEAAVVAAALLLPPRLVPLLVLGAALAQVLAKGTLYGLARWAPRGIPRRARARLDRIAQLAARRRSLTVIVLASSTVGVPPFYLVSLACGTLAAPFGAFLSAALVGALLRYAVVSLATVLVRGGA
jgi:membrane protein YqaA with SNARE-associated domain